MVRSIPYTLVTAFSHNLFGGNPAAVVYLQDDIPDDVILQGIADNLSQPMVAYITTSLPTTEKHTAAFGIRWFATREVPLCGHATIAAAKAMWSVPGMVPDNVTTIEFHTTLGVVLKVFKGDGEWLEIELPAATLEEVVDEKEKARIQDLVSQALGKEVHVKSLGVGGEGFKHMLMVELEASDNLAECKVDASKLRDSGRYINALTTASPNEDATFHIRMFAPRHILGSGEDPVCGSAHCLVGPYWAKKLGVTDKAEMKSKQVSPRGGDLKVVYDEDKDTIRLMGQLRVIAKGELLL